jgi:hypothetical protein
MNFRGLKPLLAKNLTVEVRTVRGNLEERAQRSLEHDITLKCDAEAEQRIECGGQKRRCSFSMRWPALLNMPEDIGGV